MELEAGYSEAGYMLDRQMGHFRYSIAKVPYPAHNIH